MVCRPAQAVYDQRQGIESARLYGNINRYAYYFADLLVGSPKAQRVSVIVDTGSVLCGFPCADCQHCGKHIDKPFSIDRSDSAHWIACSEECDGGCERGLCSYTQTYTEGSSISGVWFRDVVRLGDPPQRNPLVNATLGCHSDERKLFYTQRVNGIMGMAPHRAYGRPTILHDLFVDKQHIDTRIFSLCLAEWGGHLSVGGFAPQFHLDGSQIQWIPLLPSEYYSVSVTGLSMGNLSLASGVFGTTIVDSGTTFTYFPTQVYSRLLASIVTACSSGPGCSARREGANCWRLEDGSLRPRRFPVLTIIFSSSVSVEWTPEAYLFQRGDPKLWCHSFAENGAETNTVLGVSFMLYKDVIFDLQSFRLGVVSAACPEHHTDTDRGNADPGGLAALARVSADSQQGRLLVALLVMVTISSSVIAVGLLVSLFFGSCRQTEDDKDELAPSYTSRFSRSQDARTSSRCSSVMVVEDRYLHAESGRAPPVRRPVVRDL